jgi:hypothetical protein
VIGKRSQDSSMNESVLLQMPFVGRELHRASSVAHVRQFHSQVGDKVGTIKDASHGIPPRVIPVHVSSPGPTYAKRHEFVILYFEVWDDCRRERGRVD